MTLCNSWTIAWTDTSWITVQYWTPACAAAAVIVWSVTRTDTHTPILVKTGLCWCTAMSTEYQTINSLQSLTKLPVVLTIVITRTQIGSFLLVHGNVKPMNDYEGSWLHCSPYSTLESINMCWTIMLMYESLCRICANCYRWQSGSNSSTAVCKHRLDTAVCKHRLGLCLRCWHSRLICSTCAGSTEALSWNKQMCVWTINRCLMSAAICLTTNNLKLQSLCQPLNHKYSSWPWLLP